jgi:hypothetical protein
LVDLLGEFFFLQLVEKLLLLFVQGDVQLRVGFALFHVTIEQGEAYALARVCALWNWDLCEGVQVDVHLGLALIDLLAFLVHLVDFFLFWNFLL